jgi:hypothetical protein
MDVLYEDPWVQCGREALTIRGYYFPFATPLVLDLGRPVRPVITPADPEQVKAIIDEQCRFPRTPFV